MAATLTRLYSDFVIVTQTGVDEVGKEILKKSTLGKLAATASEQDVFDVVQGMENVLTYPILEIQRLDHSSIVNV